MTDPAAASDRPGFALDLSREGAALFRKSDSGGWSEVERLPLQLGLVGSSMARLRAAAGAGTAPLPVELWLDDGQVLIRAINTGGVPPVPSMIDTAFADATPEGLSGVVLEGPPRPSGPLFIAAGLARSVLEEAISFVEPHGFAVTALTTPEPPAGLDHAPVFLPERPAARAAAGGLISPKALLGGAIAALLLGGAFTAGVLTRETPEAALRVTDTVRQVSVAPDSGAALLRSLGPEAAPQAPRALPAEPRITVQSRDPAFAIPTAPTRPAEAQDSVLALGLPAHVTTPPATTQADALPTRGATPGALALADGALPSTLGTPVQTAVTGPGDPATTIAAPTLTAPVQPAIASTARPGLSVEGGASSTLPDLAGVRSRPEGPAPQTPQLALALRAPQEGATATAPAILALPTRAALPTLASTTAPAPATALNAQPARLVIVRARPDIVPPLRPNPGPALAEATTPEIESPADTTPLVEVTRARPDIIPPLRPRDETPEAAAETLSPDTQATTLTEGPAATPLAEATDQAETPAPSDTLTDAPEASPPALAESPTADAPGTPAETALAALTPDTPAADDTTQPLVVVTNTQPPIVPPLRPRAEPAEETTAETTPETPAESELAALTTEETAEETTNTVRVISARPDILPPLRPRPDPAPTPEPTTEIAALIDEAGAEDLSASDDALTLTVAPRKRPAGMVTAERERIAAAARAEEERLALLQPSENALTISSTPRKRPAGLAGPQVASLAPPAATTSAAPAPSSTSTARRSAPPLPTSASVARAATIQNALPMRQMALIGVFGKSGSRHALLRMSNGRLVKVEPGDTVSGFSVSAISADAIRLRRGGRDTLLVIPD